jgi:Protein of unknown function (DUF1573)
MGKKAHRKHVASKPRPDPAASRPRTKKRVWLLTAIAGLLVVVGAAFMLPDSPEAELQYTRDEIVYDQPIHAVHEMTPESKISFLPLIQPQPKIEIPTMFYDLGHVGAKAVVERKFIIRNTGEAPLTISRAYTTCGCTTAHLTARVIPPGRAALVTLIFDAGFHDARGKRVERGLIIESNDRRNPKSELWVRAAVGWS